ncbi:MAG: Signal transduction histidine [Rhodospirillaceae bacterium]|nr:MAG: Signal transduction histidine [Rhodospirillaceae bacterium]TNC98547.1 MAG: Signal transduction histidine kinase [Stygiobacter sp.]
MRLVTSVPAAGFLLMGLYVLLAVGAASLASLPPGNLTVFWLPAGIGVALVALLGPRLGVPAVFAASLVANFLSMNPGHPLVAMVSATALSALVDCGQSWLAWWLWRRAEDKHHLPLLRGPRHLSCLGRLLRISVLPPLLTVWMLPLIHFALGTAELDPTSYVSRVAMLISADTCGLFLILPVILAIRDRIRPLESTTLVTAGLILGAAQATLSAIDPLLAPLSLFGLTLLAFRFHLAGAALGNLICATIMVAQASLGIGPLGQGAAAHTVFSLNLTILGVGITVLYMGMLQAQQRRMQENLEAEVLRRTEQLEEHSRALAVSNSDLEHFAYVASHDLREPLRMISSYLSLLERRLTASLDDETRTFLGFARDGAKRMDRLILDLLDYSRLGRGDTKAQAVDLDEILAQVQADLALVLEKSGAVIAAGALPVVAGNHSEITRLFQNLIGNAVKFAAADRPPSIRIDAESQGALWRITIADNGIGIPADQRERVFGIFQRLHGISQYEGTGIGLAACKRIVELHGGLIQVQPSTGQGCTISFTLPSA